MAATKLSSQDKKDLDKFTKYLVYKCIQIIVQSRLGEKKKTQSKPFSSGSDWFNLAIKDLPEVLAETKKIYTSSSLIFKNNINVETSLKTSEGENMILEVWSLSMNSDQCDSARVSYTVYNRMSVLLKSLLCVSRVTPAYKLSRNQGSETYVVCYRIYMGEPVTNCLGNGSSSRKVGMVPTPAGTISLSLAYRTKIMFSPHQSTLSIELKDDHFTSDASSPKRGNTPRPCKAIPRRHSSCTTPDQEGEAEYCATSFSTSPTSPFRQSPRQIRRKSSSGDSCKQFNGAVPVENGHSNEITAENKSSLSKGLKLGAFASSTITEQPKPDDDIPFYTLLHRTTDSNANKQVTIVTEPSSGQVAMVTESREDAVDNGPTSEQQQQQQWRRRRHASADSAKSNDREDFVMVELKTPFAGQEGASELGRFYRECQGAPALHLCEDGDPSSGPAGGTQQQLINSITDQLMHFESNVQEFDDFIDSLLLDD